jgi:hypothetical protein
MTSRSETASETFDEQTLPEPEPTPRRAAPPVPAREVCILDFKGRATTVAVAHGPADPSRIRIVVRSATAVLHVTVEEEVGRDLADGLTRALATFRSVRSRFG